MVDLVKILFVVGSYLAGSLSFSVIFHKIFKGEDIRTKDLAGAAGAVRQMGLAKGCLVGFFDLLKVLAPVFFALFLNLGYLTVSLCALSALLGHNWPIFFRFKGGQGLSSIIGGLILLIPLEGLFAFIGATAVLSPRFKFTWKNRSSMPQIVLSKITAIFIIVTLGLYRLQPIEYIYTAIIMFLINILKNIIDKPQLSNANNY